MTVRLLADVANDRKGAVLELPRDRAQRLIRTGYAVAVASDIPMDGDALAQTPRKRKGKE